MKKKRRYVPKYDTDRFMKKLWLSLVRDFRSVLGPDYAHDAEEAFVRGGITGLRSYKWPERLQAPPWLFKAEYQLENLFKRYRFKKDVYTDNELAAITKEKFLETQLRIAVPLQIDSVTLRVLQEARRIVKSILGQYDPAEHHSLCRFGKKASVGHPLAQSYLDCKLAGPITGSHDHITWFKNQYLPSDPMLAEVLKQRGQNIGKPLYTVCETLTLTNVPKSWKSFRSIMPNTDIGGFYTYGLDRLIREKLRVVAKLDIRVLQHVHQILARKASKNRRHATADLSAASDAPTWELIARLVPRPWLKVLNFGRIRHVMIDNDRYSLQSFMTMGIGFTFPLETLIFYALLLAMKNLLKLEKGRISVYGDDLIYPSELHKVVKHVFPRLHLKLNEDKTYVTSNFRESCGGDYYHGTDVRPFSPEGECQNLPARRYAAFLYKIYNGIRRRWLDEEIPRTCNFLLSEILNVEGIIYQVPPSYPDTSGVKVDAPLETWYMNFSPVLRTKHDPNTLVFRYLREMSDDRVVPNLHPYLWDKLKFASDIQQASNFFVDPESGNIYDKQYLDYQWMLRDWALSPWEAKPETISWVRIQYGKPQCRKGKRVPQVQVQPCVASRSATKIVCQSGSTSCWI